MKTSACDERNAPTAEMDEQDGRTVLPAFYLLRTGALMAVSKRLRHEILRRDNFTCQSCGAKAPDVKLEPDHVVPTTLGGSDHPSNLQTLCTDCNAGKSATPPDAATIAKVADDAERWARAMETAAGKILGARADREKARAAFDAKWVSWADGRPPLPRPAGWEMSVDSFLKAGLPLEVLLDCVDIAMSRRQVRSGDVFKYTCGIAWKEVRQLQKEAHALLEPDAPPSEAPDNVVVLWEDAVSDLLTVLTQDEWRIHGLEDVDLYSLEMNEDERYPIAAAFDAVISDLKSDLWDLTSEIDALLRALPDGVGERAMRIARTRMYDVLSLENITRHRFASWALRMAVRLYEIEDAKEYLGRLPTDQRDAWLRYAATVREVEATTRGAAPWQEVGEGHRHLFAAQHARSAERGETPAFMCQSPGAVIVCCSQVAKFLVLVEESECCEGQTLETHGDHPLCESHLAALVDGTFRTPDGDSRTIRDFKELLMPAEEDPPF